MSAEKGQFHEMPRDAARSFCLRAPLPCPASSSARGVIPLICSRRPNQSSCGNCLLCRGRAPKWGFSRVEGAAGPPTLPIGDDSHAAAASPALPAPAEPPALPRRGARPRRAPRWPPLPLPAPEPTATVRSRTPFPMAGLSSGRCARSAAGRAPPASPTVPCSAASGRLYPAQGRGGPPPPPRGRRRRHRFGHRRAYRPAPRRGGGIRSRGARRPQPEARRSDQWHGPRGPPRPPQVARPPQEQRRARRVPRARRPLRVPPA